MIFLQKPQKFEPVYEVAACFVEFEDKILLLKRAPNKLSPGKWGLPAGKIDQGEDAQAAALRELHEETGLVVLADTMIFLQTVFVEFPDYDFIFHMFRTTCTTQPAVVLNPIEHTHFKWCSIEEALRMDGVEDLDTCIKLVYRQ
jgi:8-oxo-dGTP diphosphatase